MKKRPNDPETSGAAAAPAPARAEEAAAAADPERERLAAENARLAAEIETLKQRLLETAADLDNQAKRFARERQVVREEAVVRTAREMIEVLDNLDRVLAAAPAELRASPLLQGVAATQALFLDKLRALGVEPIAADGRPFDPFQHEALFEEERDDVPPGTVVAEIARGWRTQNQLVRAAKVRVSKARASAANKARADEAGADDSDEPSNGAPGAPS